LTCLDTRRHLREQSVNVHGRPPKFASVVTHFVTQQLAAGHRFDGTDD
jgi:hypothetical protein